VSGTATAFIPNAISMSAVRITGRLKVGEISVHSEGGALKAGDRRILNDADMQGGTVQAPLPISVSGDVSGHGTTGNGGLSLQLANNGVTPGRYGSGTGVPVVTIDAKGRVTDVKETPVSLRDGGQLGWRDLTSELFARTSGSAAPTLTLFRGMLYA
jgi:hypothetical protein